MTITRTQDEILARINDIATLEREQDMFGKRREVLIYALTAEAAVANGFIKDGVTAEDLLSGVEPWTGPDGTLDRAREYLDFAVMKIADERGLSASRSVDAFQEYVWLLTDDSTEAVYLTVDYAPYGQPQIEYAAEKLDLVDAFNEAAVRHGLHAEPTA